MRHAERDCLADGGGGVSVLIKGMEMPTSCGDCKAFVCYKQWAGDMGDCFCGITKEDAKAKEKNADCPLVPVPPHGRLIDADALAEHKFVCIPHVSINGKDAGTAYRLGWNTAIEAVMENAETIIGGE